MSRPEIIEDLYREAVKGINEEWFTKESTKWYDYIVELPEDLRITYLMVVFYNQMSNGGFHQYFVNGYGQFARETINSLIMIGASKKAELLKRALSIVNSENSADEIFRKKLLRREILLLFNEDDLFEPLNNLDTKFYADNSEDIQSLLGDYLRR